MTSMTAMLAGLWDGAVPAEVSERVEAAGFDTNEWGYDELGLSEHWLKRVAMVSTWLYRNYFRVQTSGLRNVPDGPALLVGNHSTQMAYDGMMVLTALFLECDPPQHAAPMGAYQFARNPLYSEFMPRMGQLTGTPANCRLLLERGRKVLVFPEGEQGGGKTLFNRYKLMPFGHGFMRIAYDSGVPVVPFAFIGGEEMVPSFSRLRPLARRIGMQYFPASPTGFVPLPTKCSIHFGEPRCFGGDPEDEEAITADVSTVANDVRGLCAEGLRRRNGVFL